MRSSMEFNPYNNMYEAPFRPFGRNSKNDHSRLMCYGQRPEQRDWQNRSLQGDRFKKRYNEPFTKIPEPKKTSEYHYSTGRFSFKHVFGIKPKEFYEQSLEEVSQQICTDKIDSPNLSVIEQKTSTNASH